MAKKTQAPEDQAPQEQIPEDQAPPPDPAASDDTSSAGSDENAAPEGTDVAGNDTGEARSQGADGPVFDAGGEIDKSREQHGINPQKIVSGTTGRKVGSHSEELLPQVDPVTANAALIPDGQKPHVPDLEAAGVEIPEYRTPAGSDDVPEAPPPKPGLVQVRGTADNPPFYSGGPIRKGQVVNVTEEEADDLLGKGLVERA